MHKLVRISEFNRRKLHLMRERPMHGGGLRTILSTIHKFYKMAAPAVKLANAAYRAPLVQKHIIPKSVKKHVNKISNHLSDITGTVDAIGEAHKFFTGGGREDLITIGDVAVKKVEKNPAEDLLKLVSKKAKSMKKPTHEGAGLYPVGKSKSCMTGGGLTNDILKKIISVIAIEMIDVVVKQVNIKMKLSDEKSKALEKFLKSKLTEMLKADLPSLPNALLSVGKFDAAPLKHMFGGGKLYKQSKTIIMKRINKTYRNLTRKFQGT